MYAPGYLIPDTIRAEYTCHRRLSSFPEEVLTPEDVHSYFRLHMCATSATQGKTYDVINTCKVFRDDRYSDTPY